jgi:hypothetical protein
LTSYNYLDNKPFDHYVKLAADRYQNKINSGNWGMKYAQLMFNINGADTQVVVELFDATAPRTCANFLALCR